MPEYNRRLTTEELGIDEAEQIRDLIADWRSYGQQLRQPDTAAAERGWIASIRREIRQAIRNIRNRK